MSTSPPLSREHLVKSEWAPGGWAHCPPGDTRRDPTSEEIARRQEANLVTVTELNRRLGEDVVRWLMEKKLLGEPQTIKRPSRFRYIGGWTRSTEGAFLRDQAERGLDELRRMAEPAVRWR